MKSPQSAVVNSASVAAALGSIPVPGDELESLTRALISPHRSALRFRREVCIEDFPFSTRPVPWYRLGRYMEDDSIQPSRLLAYPCGDYFLQDAGSLLALAVCDADTDPEIDADNGTLICDLCAAPGGKASALLERIGDDGFLLANEPISSRLAPLSYNLARTGSDRYAITNCDPHQLAERLPGIFDVVLVDAPCSGQALLSRGRQSASAMSERQIVHSAARQRRILSAALSLVRPGGHLIYSTCTFAHAENEQQVDWLRDQGHVDPHPIGRLSLYASAEACYRLWPHRHDCAGSFAASMIATADAAVHQSKRSWKRKRGDRLPTAAEACLSEINDESMRTKTYGAVVFGWPHDAPDWIDELAVAGPELMHRTGQTWKPSHAAALRRVPRAQPKQSIDVDAETAKQYLSGEPIACHGDGWQVVRHQSQALGWIKASRGTGKNHLPVAARLTGPWL